MKARAARFVTAAVKAGAFPPPAGPEVVFAGRSNVGKSSLLNALTGSRGLARVSRSPGRTQQINFFATGGMGTFVDLPGYGFARVPDRVRAAWQRLVDGYLQADRPVSLLLLLVDARHDPSPLDVQMLDWLRDHDLPWLVVLTKSDAVSGSRMRETVRRAREVLGLDEADERPAPVSARTGKGIKELRARIHRAVNS